MTRTITIRTCHIHIGLWIFATIGLLYSMNYMHLVLIDCIKTGYCYYESSYDMFYWFLIIIEILIQIIALFGWNKHFKWFTFELKSCWSKTND